MEVVLAKDLKERFGLSLSGSRIKQLIAAGKFPRPFKLSEGGRLNCWTVTEIEKWLEERLAKERGPKHNGEA
jgi:predicted DNA-binding transcriptional regulator AlpA